jgi:hypothetical protein
LHISANNNYIKQLNEHVHVGRSYAQLYMCSQYTWGHMVEGEDRQVPCACVGSCIHCCCKRNTLHAYSASWLYQLTCCICNYPGLLDCFLDRLHSRVRAGFGFRGFHPHIFFFSEVRPWHSKDTFFLYTRRAKCYVAKIWS